jgi:hypothetical protein
MATVYHTHMGKTRLDDSGLAPISRSTAYTPVSLLGDPNDAASRTSACISCGLAELVTALAKVILISVDHHCAANDGILSGQADHAVRDVDLGYTVLGHHITQISRMASTLGILGGPMLAAVRVEVRSRGHAPVRVVTKLMNMESMKSVRQTLQLTGKGDWSSFLLFEVNSSSHGLTLENTDRLHLYNLL